MKFMSAKFNFYEKVLVSSEDKNLAEINGELGAIIGRVQNDDGVWIYGVQIYRDGEGWDIYEKDLESTGEFASEESFYSGDSIKVKVNDSDEGEIIN